MPKRSRPGVTGVGVLPQRMVDDRALLQILDGESSELTIGSAATLTDI